MSLYGSRYAITFGEVGIVHYGAAELGKIAEEGFTVDDLKSIKDKVEEEFKI